MAKPEQNFQLCEPYDKQGYESVLCKICGYIHYKAKLVQDAKNGTFSCPRCFLVKNPPKEEEKKI